jgi:hypothetical protein
MPVVTIEHTPSSSDVIMYAYIAWDLLTNLETFSTLIDFQKKCYGKYTPKYVFLTVAMPVVTIEHTSIFSPSNCIIP